MAWFRAKYKLRNTNRKYISITFVIVCLLIVALLSRLIFPNSKTVADVEHDIGSNITVTGKEVPPSLKAVQVQKPGIALEGFNYAAPPVSITPSGPLPAPITLTFKLLKPVAKGTPVIVATRETSRNGWSYINPTISQNGLYATIQTNHLSIYSVLEGNVSFYINFTKALVENLSGENISKASQPQCQNNSGALRNNYLVDNSTGSTLYWCFGLENGNRVLKVVNNRKFPLELSNTKGLSNLSDGPISADLDQIARLTGSSSLITTFPGEEADYSANINTNQNATLEAQWNSSASTLDLLQSGLLALSTIISRSEFGKAALTTSQSYAAINTVLGQRDCFNAVKSGDSAQMLIDCFSDAAKEGLLSESTNVALAYAQAFGMVASSIVNEVSGLIHSLSAPNGGELYELLVHRGAQLSQPQSITPTTSTSKPNIKTSAPSGYNSSCWVDNPYEPYAGFSLTGNPPSSFVGTWNFYTGSLDPGTEQTLVINANGDATVFKGASTSTPVQGTLHFYPTPTRFLSYMKGCNSSVVPNDGTAVGSNDGMNFLYVLKDPGVFAYAPYNSPGLIQYFCTPAASSIPELQTTCKFSGAGLVSVLPLD